MKLKIWIGPLIVVIILFTLRQMVNNLNQDERQRSVIHAVKKQPSASVDWRIFEGNAGFKSPYGRYPSATNILPF